MNRRQLLAIIGAIGGTGAVVNGTGAFTTVQANRDVSVSVTDDALAYLAIDDTGNANDEYVSESGGGEFGIDLTGSNTTSGGGSGVNTDAVTVIEDLFEVRNQGTQDVDVSVTPLTFVDTNSGNTLIVLVVPDTNFPTVNLSPGNAETYSLVVDVYPGGTNTSVDDTITVSGVAP
ncbi:hypothetical protein EI982_02020 [Haloplanus rallus]|uniref:DUF1102 domain-containing protein n=1 Tax=Haloplanus rallus TaxID=1816183 RepID=A0A6B9F5P2_9EURY|nr:hypothetical protein [Haloplanus rallus]QGX93654.1 hypothetical protein EI982_02020 [Haloplanus rallus]